VKEEGNGKKDKGRSKEEILEIRKEMMKSKVKVKKDNFVGDDEDKKKKDPPQELMYRLAKGEKA
jgi:hypothetical protein